MIRGNFPRGLSVYLLVAPQMTAFDCLGYDSIP